MHAKTLLASFIVLSFLAACTPTPGSNQNEVGGTLVGAGAGALIGSQFGSGAGKLVAVGAGALIGAIVGNEAGKSLDNGNKPQVVIQQQVPTVSPPPPEAPPTPVPTTTSTSIVVNGPGYWAEPALWCQDYTENIYVNGVFQYSQFAGHHCMTVYGNSWGPWRWGYRHRDFH